VDSGNGEQLVLKEYQRVLEQCDVTCFNFMLDVILVLP